MPNLPDCAPGSCNKEGSPPGCRAKGAGSKGSPGPPRRTVPSGGVATSTRRRRAFRAVWERRLSEKADLLCLMTHLCHKPGGGTTEIPQCSSLSW